MASLVIGKAPTKFEPNQKIQIKSISGFGRELLSSYLNQWEIHKLLSNYGITRITAELLGNSRITGITAELLSNTRITELLTQNPNDPVLAITLVF